VFGAKRALHSGHYGDWVPNPALMLAQLENLDGAFVRAKPCLLVDEARKVMAVAEEGDQPHGRKAQRKMPSPTPPEDQQRSFDATCRKFYRFLKDRNIESP
jgi:hypothetical protein